MIMFIVNAEFEFFDISDLTCSTWCFLDECVILWQQSKIHKSGTAPCCNVQGWPKNSLIVRAGNLAVALKADAYSNGHTYTFDSMRKAIFCIQMYHQT